jgi:hypothetical protein
VSRTRAYSREKLIILFPIMLDGAVMETNQAWAASIRRQRHIGDFRQLKNPLSYRKAFKRLLRDLTDKHKASKRG